MNPDDLPGGTWDGRLRPTDLVYTLNGATAAKPQASKKPEPAKETKPNSGRTERIETVGFRADTKEDVYVVAGFPSSDDGERYRMDKEFQIYESQGKAVKNPKFYRSTVTILETIEEITEDEWWAAQLNKAEDEPTW